MLIRLAESSLFLRVLILEQYFYDLPIDKLARLRYNIDNQARDKGENNIDRNEKIALRKVLQMQIPDTDPRYDNVMFALMFNDNFDLASFGFSAEEIKFPADYQYPSPFANAENEDDDG